MKISNKQELQEIAFNNSWDIGYGNVLNLDKKFTAIHLLTAWKVSKYGVFSGPYFPVFRLNTEKYGTGKKLCIWTLFHAVTFLVIDTTVASDNHLSFRKIF